MQAINGEEAEMTSEWFKAWNTHSFKNLVQFQINRTIALFHLNFFDTIRTATHIRYLENRIDYKFLAKIMSIFHSKFNSDRLLQIARNLRKCG